MNENNKREEIVLIQTESGDDYEDVARGIKTTVDSMFKGDVFLFPFDAANPVRTACSLLRSKGRKIESKKFVLDGKEFIRVERK